MARPAGLPPDLLFGAALVAALGLFRFARRQFWLFSLVVLPGTLCHELCHWLMAILLNGRPTRFSLWPKREAQGWVLGSVYFANPRWYNAFFIGLAPLGLLPLAYLLIRWRLGLGPALGLVEALAVYGIANLIYAATPSWADLKIAARSPIGWLLLAGGLGWAWLAWQCGQTPSAPTGGHPVQGGAARFP